MKKIGKRIGKKLTENNIFPTIIIILINLVIIIAIVKVFVTFRNFVCQLMIMQ